jgi:hypothetical protein
LHGKVHHDYNFFGLEHTNVASKSAVEGADVVGGPNVRCGAVA